MNPVAKFLLKMYSLFVIKNQKYIIFESGRSFNDNAYALYQYVKKNFPEYKRKYLVTSKEMKALGDKAGVDKKEMLLVSKKLSLYRYSLKSKAIFFSYINYWKKLKLTDKTKLVYTTHGEFPLKDCTKFYEYLCEPQQNKMDIATRTEYTKEILERKYPILSNHNLVVLGMPRSDALFNCNINKNEILEKLNAQKDLKIIISMTTFRSENERVSYFDHEFPISLNNEDLDKINEVLKQNNELLLIKLHPTQENNLVPENKENIKFITNKEIVELGLTIQTLYSICDAMITDYSTAYLGYLSLDRKIVFITTDKEKYTADRGWTVENVEEIMPGIKINTKEELINVLKNLEKEDEYKENRQAIKLKLVGDYKDQNCKSFTDKYLN